VQPPEDEGGVTPAVLSPDGRYVASASWHFRWGLGSEILYSAHVWDANTGARIGSVPVGYDKRFDIVEFDPHSKYMASGDRDNISVLELATGKVVTTIPYQVWKNSIAKSPDGKYVISKEDKFFILHELFHEGGKVIARLEQDDEITCVDISADGKYVVSGSKDGIARVCVASTGREISRMNHASKVTSVAFSPGGNYVASASEKIIIVWKPEKGNNMVISTPLIDSYDVSAPYKPAYSHSSDLELVRPDDISRTTSASFTLDNKYEIHWERNSVSVKEIGMVVNSVPKKEFVMNEKPDEKYRVLVTKNIARVLDATDKEVAHMTHNGDVTNAVFSPDGKYVISGDDNTVLAWMWQAEDIIAATCAAMPRNLNRAEWEQYIGDTLPYQAVCEYLPIEPEPTAAPKRN
jgi:WD40 repeat protein